MCIFGSLGEESSKETEHVFALDDKERSEVDFGIWERFDCRDLIVPLDTHVCRVAYALGLTETETFSLKNARRITEALAEAFPDDPCLGTLLCLEAESAEYCSALPVYFLYPSAS